MLWLWSLCNMLWKWCHNNSTYSRSSNAMYINKGRFRWVTLSSTPCYEVEQLSQHFLWCICEKYTCFSSVSTATIKMLVITDLRMIGIHTEGVDLKRLYQVMDCDLLRLWSGTKSNWVVIKFIDFCEGVILFTMESA